MRKFITQEELELAASGVFNAVRTTKYADGMTLDEFLSLFLAYTRAAVGVEDYREIIDNGDEDEETLKESE